MINGLLMALAMAVVTATVLFGYTAYPWLSRGETLIVAMVVFVYASLCYRLEARVAARKPE